MPQGKGTYGSQVGRPPKKQKKYQEGGEVEAILEAAKMGQELKSIPLESVEPEFPIEEEQGFPTTNAPDRVESYQLGGMIEPPTAPSITPTPQYKKGGKVDVTDIVKKAERQKKIQKDIDESQADKVAKDYYKKGHKALYEKQIRTMKKKILKKKKK